MSENVTILLKSISNGSRENYDKVFAMVYAELRNIANKHMKGEKPSHTLQPTALVNEAYLKLIGTQQIDWQNRSHFYAMCARVMRQILIDHARSKLASKRGDGAANLTLDEGLVAVGQDRDLEQLLTLDAALDKLKALDERKAKVVELRYFAGLSLDETAEALDASKATIKRDWVFSKAMLEKFMSEKQNESR